MERTSSDRFDFDPRWVIQNGIGRFAAEVKPRLGLPDALLSGPPLSAGGLLRTTARLLANSDRLLYSPGFNGTAAGYDRLILTIHDLIHLDEPGESSHGRRFYYQRFIRPVVRLAPRVLTVSEYSRGRIADWADVDPSKIVNVSNGRSQAFTPDGPVHKQSRPFFLYVGNAKPHKNLPLLVDAVDALGQCRMISLVIIGVSNPHDQRQLRQRLGATNATLHFQNGIDDQTLASLYRGAVATVQPSRIEGFGLPVVEALSTGCPVIASRATALPEAGGDVADYFQPNNHDELVDQMRYRLEQRGGLDPHRQARIDHGSLFTWDAVGKRIVAALRSI